MYLACFTTTFVLFCGSQFNYVHDLADGHQWATPTQAKICEIGKLLLQDKNVYVVALGDCMQEDVTIECECPVPPNQPFPLR